MSGSTGTSQVKASDSASPSCRLPSEPSPSDAPCREPEVGEVGAQGCCTVIVEVVLVVVEDSEAREDGSLSRRWGTYIHTPWLTSRRRGARLL